MKVSAIEIKNGTLHLDGKAIDNCPVTKLSVSNVDVGMEICELSITMLLPETKVIISEYKEQERTIGFAPK